MKVGICLPDLGLSQLAYFAIGNANKYITTKQDVSFIAFYQDAIPLALRPQFPLLHSFEVFNYDGNLIATDIKTAKSVISAFSSPNKIFYVWDLEWIRQPKKDFNELYKIYNHPQIKLIARSEEHKQAIESLWNVKVIDIVDNFDYDRLLIHCTR